jgi:hypothetical protein
MMDRIDDWLTRHTRAIAIVVTLYIIAMVGSVALKP